ncbi:MAG TPA: hypothetical protein DIC19_05725 [Erysipelotrichaceae bacterium]|nr:hypothetical protein [Erysipelotrichaceae bacterium]
MTRNSKININANSVLENLIQLILFTIVGSVLIQTIIYFLGFKLTIVSFILPFFVYPIYQIYIAKKRRISIPDLLIAYLLYLLVVFILLTYFSNFIEHSYDGNMYHGETMVQLLWGWNPIYDKDLHFYTYATQWSVLYPKLTWIYGALWLKLTDMSSSAMIMNSLIAIIVSLKTYLFASKHLKNKIYGLILAIIVLVNPIFIEQIHTFYVDAMIGNLTLLLLIYNLEYTEEFSLSSLINIAFISIILINVKFTGFVFAGLIDLGAFIYLLVKHKKQALHYFLNGIYLLIIGVVIIGFSPYMNNIINLRHIFFPLMGKDKWDIISFLIPEQIINLRPYDRFIYSLSMGKSIRENLSYFGEYGYLHYDQRIGGFGGHFLKLLVISSSIIGVYVLSSIKKIKLNFLLIISMFFITIIANYQNIWWARYAPQLWFIIPVAMFALIIKARNIYIHLPILIIISYLVLFQSIDIYKNTLDMDLTVTKEIKSVYETLRKEDDLTLFINTNNRNLFSVFEEYRSIEHGLDIKKIIIEEPNALYTCYRVDNYHICSVRE